MKKTIIVICIGILINGCGGNGISDNTAVTDSITVQNISGVVSDGPINNARVYIDINHNGKYDDGELSDITDINGSYSIPYVDFGREYMIIAEGSKELNTTDLVDNNDSNMSFVMYKTLDLSSPQSMNNINPQSFKEYLTSLDSNESNISSLVNADSNLSDKELFGSFIDNNKEHFMSTFEKISLSLGDKDINKISKFPCREDLDTDIDIKMQKNADAYYPYLYGYLLPGIWVQHEYDTNGQAKANELGIDWKYQFTTSGDILMNISIIDVWIPLEDYCVDISEKRLTFNEGSASSTVYFEVIKDMGNYCLKIAKYKIEDNNVSFDNYYQLCKVGS